VNSSIAVGSACARTLRRGALAVCLPAAAFLAATSAGDGSGARAGQPARPDHAIRLSRPRVTVPSLAAFGPLPELRVPLAPVAPPHVTPPAPAVPPAQPAPPAEPAQPPRPADPEFPPPSEEDPAEDELFEDTPASDTPDVPAADPAASDPPEATPDPPAPAGTPAPRFRRARP
jgi:hypothetical protein